MAKKKTVISKVQEIINDTVKKEKEKDAKIDKELEEREMDTLPFIFSTRYASHLRLADLYSSDESFLKNFDEVARQYRKP